MKISQKLSLNYHQISSSTHLISSAENLEFVSQWLILQIKEALGCISVVSWVNLLCCLCKNKGADQLCGNHTADQRLCFCYIDSTITLLSISEISSLKPS